MSDGEVVVEVGAHVEVLVEVDLVDGKLSFTRVLLECFLKGQLKEDSALYRDIYIYIYIYLYHYKDILVY